MAVALASLLAWVDHAGAGSPPQIQVTPATITFGDQRINTTSAPQSVEIKNTGGSDLTVADATLVGADTSSFGVTGWPGSPVVLTSGQSLTLSGTFAPATTGAKTATLMISSDDPVRPTVDVSLTGNGTTAIIGLSPDPVAFGNVAVGGSADLPLNVANSGTAPLNVQSVAIIGPDASQFSVAAGAPPFTVPPASSQPISLRCAPTTPGPKSATANVNSDADSGTNSVALTCTGTAPATSCLGDAISVPDGRVVESFIPDGATAWLGASLRIGGSYSVELRSGTGAGTPLTTTFYSGDDGCGGTSTLATTNTAGIDPAGGPGAVRVSFTAAGAQTHFRARLDNATGADVEFTFSWSETTMFSPAWSDNGAFDTFYSFLNTTGATIDGTLELVDPAGGTLASASLSIPAGQTAATNTASLGVARNRTGTARFTHDGPPGALVAEAAIAYFAISPAYVQPVKFEAVRQATH